MSSGRKVSGEKTKRAGERKKNGGNAAGSRKGRGSQNGADPRLRSTLLMLERQAELRRRILAAGGIILAAAASVVILIVLAGRFQSSSGRTEKRETGQEGLSLISEVQEVQEVQESIPAEAGQALPPQSDLFPVPGEGYTEKITILGTGDNIIHEQLYEDAGTEDGGYDFTPFYRLVKPYIEEADIASVNQESPLASELYPPSGYPAFNAPVQVADALHDAGFDVLNLANNHILDQGDDGLYATLDYLQQNGYRYFGAYMNADEKAKPTVLEANGIRVGFVGTLDFTNKDPSGEMEELLIWNDEEEDVREAIEQAGEAADIVVVYAHWGEENEPVLTESMVDLAQKMADWGADVIFGDHTHLVQEVAVLERESDGKKVPVQYCGGNFLSGQKERNHLLSILTYVEFSKNPDTGDVVCTGLHCRPLVTHYEGDRKNACVYPLSDYTEELAAEHGVKQFENEPMTLDYLWSWIRSMVPEEYLIA